MKQVAMLVFLFPLLSALGQTPQTCPVKLTYVTARYRAVEDLTRIRVVGTNDTTKVVKAMKFGIYTLDAVKDKHEYPATLTDEVVLKEGKKYNGIFNIHLLSAADGGAGAIVWLQKVLFADGTTWEDDGTRTCQLASD